MSDYAVEIAKKFRLPTTSSGAAILEVLQSIIRIHGINPEELSYKWESYCMKMGAEETQLDLKTVQDFKKDLKENVDRIGKTNGAEKKVTATPRQTINTDMFDILGPGSGSMKSGPIRGSTTKRRSDFETPSAKSHKNNTMSSPLTSQKNAASSSQFTDFSDRKGAGEVVDTLNFANIEIPPSVKDSWTEPRLIPKAITKVAPFNYRTMAMKLPEASESLDDRIEKFVSIFQAHHSLNDSDFGNPVRQSQNEIIAVGRIASDAPEGKLNDASLVLETPRRMGAGSGRRIALNVDKLKDYEFFPGKIVALKGVNASGEFFQPTEVLELPNLPSAHSNISEIDEVSDRLTGSDGNSKPLVTIIAAGPYTTDDTLDFSPFNALLDAAQAANADGLILLGPFIDSEHQLIRTGDFDLPSDYPVEPDRATLTDVFKAYISRPLSQLSQRLPHCTVILCPSVRDTASKHTAWPQDKLAKRELALPPAVRVVPNPMALKLNELVLAMAAADVLEQIRAGEICAGADRAQNTLERFARQILAQRHYSPVFPPPLRAGLASAPDDQMQGLTISGANLDIVQSKLGEFDMLPDMMLTPSVLPFFAKVINGVLMINPGTLSKRKGPGTYARVIWEPLSISDEERDKGEPITNRLYERCRVDIIKI